MLSVQSAKHLESYSDFIEKSLHIIESARPDELIAVMYVDITGFQLINDFYGFSEGDRFLNSCGEFLANLARTEACARVFSDHFLRLARMNKNFDIAQNNMEYELKMNEFLGEQCLYHTNCRVCFACGYCVVENGKEGLITAIDDANLARKEAKNTGITSINWFDNEMRKKIKKRKDMEIGIQSALQNSEFTFFLQPKVNLTTGKIVGAEALARWIMEDGRMVYPDEFIPLMEQNGSITELDFLIYEKVCQYLRKRLDTGKKMIPISVNMSRINIYQKSFVSRLHEVALKYRIPQYLLEFELTETLLLEEFQSTKDAMDELRSYGYKVSIDDFGSGFTGVNIWRKLDFDVVKLDKEFISEDPYLMKRNDIIITSIVYVGRMRQTSLLCEGVEDVEQCRHMKDLGCEIAQGYYFSRPINTKQFDQELLENNGYYPVHWMELKGKDKGPGAVEEWERLALDHFYREVYDSVDCGIVQYHEDPDQKGVFYCSSLNKYAITLYGFEEKEDILLEEIDIVNDFILPEDIVANQDKIKKLNHPGDAILLDFRIRAADGVIRSVTATLKIILDQHGNHTFLGVLMDNSEQKEIERLKSQLNMVMENTPGDVIIFTIGDQSFDTRYLTTGLAKTFGYTKEDFLELMKGNNKVTLVYEDQQETVMDELHKLADARQPIDINFPVQYSNGTIGWHNLSADYIRETADDKKVYHGIITNVSKMKRQEEDLERTELSYRTAAELLDADIFRYNFTDNTLSLPVTEELSGLNLQGETKIGLIEFIKNGYIHPDYLADYLKIYDDLRNGKAIGEATLLAKTKNGTYEWFHLSYRVTVYDTSKKPLEAVGVAQKVNE